MLMPCALCKLNNQLSYSHIVPEFMYQQMYDKTGSFMALSIDPMDANRRFRKGLRENLLCSDCERKLGKWESYAATFFYGGKIAPRMDGKLFIFEKLQYHDLKLFFLSLLWRFSVTTLTEFEGLKLIPKHQEKLRLMLLADNPGGCMEFPCYVQVINRKGNFLGGFMAPPTSAKFKAHHVWQFVIAGFYFTFFVLVQRECPFWN